MSNDKYTITAVYNNIKIKINDYMKDLDPEYAIELEQSKQPKKYSQIRMVLSEECNNMLNYKNILPINNNPFYSGNKEDWDMWDNESELNELIKKLNGNIIFYNEILPKVEKMDFEYKYSFYENITDCNTFKEFFEDDNNWRE